MSRLTDDQYATAKHNLGYFQKALSLSIDKQEQLLDQLTAERECMKFYKNKLDETKSAILYEDTYREVESKIK